MGKLLIYANHKLQEFKKEKQVLDYLRPLLLFNMGFCLIVPKDAQIVKPLNEMCKELNARIEIDPGSDPTALEYFLFGVAGAGIGASQGAAIGAAIWQGILAAISAYESGGGAADIVIPGVGTFVAVGAGIGTFTGVATGVLAVKWKIKVNFQKPDGMTFSFYKKNSITITFTPT